MMDRSDVPQFQIHLLCASHVRSERHVRILFQMVDSWHAQTHPVPLHISLSYDADKAEVLKARIATKQRKYPATLRIYCHKAQKAQFQHYKWLISDKLKHLNTETDWFTFIDDDDTIAPKRMWKFDRMIASWYKATAVPGKYQVLEMVHF